MEKDKAAQLLTPACVKAIISRVETAQLARAQEDISTQLSDILDNVNGVINRFQEEVGYDLKEKTKSYQVEQKGKKRFILLEKIASFSKDAKTKEKHLNEILRWLGDWGDSLTYEMRNRKSEEEEEAMNEWVEVIEKVLPLSLITTKGGIESLVSLCSALIEEQKKRSQMPKHIFWQGWWEKSPQKSSPHPQPLSPEQMLQDKQATCTKVSEVTSMLQELLDSTMFNQGEVKAIKYMLTVVENLNKALILQHKENRNLETKYKCLQIEMATELSTQRLHFQKSIQDLEGKRDALLKQVAILGGKCHDLVLTKHALEFQLKKIQIARGPAGDPAEVSPDSPAAPEEKTLPQTGAVMEEAQQQPREEEHLFLPLSSSPMARAWDSRVTPLACLSLSTMSVHSRTTDVSLKDTEILEDHKFPTKWKRLVAEGPVHKDKKQGDHFPEKERVQLKLHFRKHLSPGSSGEVLLESPVGHWEEELCWQIRRQQWLQEEEMWLQRHREWALLEQEHQEKLRRWEMEAATRLQQQTLAWPEEERQRLRREPMGPREDTEKLIFTTTNQRRNLEKAEPPPSRTQSACQARRPSLPRSSHPQQPGPGNQRTMSSTEYTHMPQASRVPSKPKKSTSSPVTGTSIRRVTRPSQRPPVTPKEKVYHMGMEAQRKNLQLLSGEPRLGLPHYLHSKALELTTTTMELSACRLPYLCHKYVLYRHFRSLRQAVINHMQVMGETRAPNAAQSLQVLLGNIDRQQRLRLQAWTDKQKDLEEKHRECLSSMVTMFPKLRLEWNVHLNIPVVISKPKKCKSPPALLRRIYSSSPTCKQSFPPRHRECVPLWTTSASMTQRKECQQRTEQPAELVCRKLSRSLPGTLQNQKE
ncbi:PREDICTED: protein FAM186B isoform X3 [Chinchilla lanigera]|uniref:Family with sequence similarity 186 member B n=1 Tax=Chinchilla lanigera TaxID=34839 RepID=A0A8C2UKJ4_CHILA|nr:PREDICTED: protein FAM186B isoform X3 [Chinchilla lanigera]